MADDKTTGTGDDLEQQIAELKRELGNLRAALAGRAQDVVGGAAEQASRAAQGLRTQAGIVRDNPGTVSTAFIIGGIVGLLCGLTMRDSEPPRRWYERH